MQIGARIEALGDEAIRTHENAANPMALCPIEEGSVVATHAGVVGAWLAVDAGKACVKAVENLTVARGKDFRRDRRRRRAPTTDGSRASGRVARFPRRP